MTDAQDTVSCSTPGCDFIFGAYPKGMEPDDRRSPCPACGERGRSVHKTLAAEIKSTASVKYDAFPPGASSKRRRFAWGFTGWDFSRRLQRVVRKESSFNKRADRRFEHIEDPETGDVLHHQDHPLTEHKGHGSDTKTPRV